jgi:hypothetical protein
MRRLVLFALFILACDSGPPPPPDAAAYPPPQRACGDLDAGDAGDPCAPPPGGCTGSYQYYYDDGVCTNGQCAWQTKFYYCPCGCYQSNLCYSCSSETAPYAGGHPP